MLDQSDRGPVDANRGRFSEPAEDRNFVAPDRHQRPRTKHGAVTRSVSLVRTHDDRRTQCGAMS
jgi:hypothetical protein